MITFLDSISISYVAGIAIILIVAGVYISQINSHGFGGGVQFPLFFSIVFITIFFASCHPKHLFADQIDVVTNNLKAEKVETAKVNKTHKQGKKLYYVKSKQYDICKNDILDTLEYPDSYENKNSPKTRSFAMINENKNRWEVGIYYDSINKEGRKVHSKAVCIVNKGKNKIIENRVIEIS